MADRREAFARLPRPGRGDGGRAGPGDRTRHHPEHKPAAPGAPRGFGSPSSSCLEGTASAETIPGLAPRPGEIVVRRRGYDAFAGTRLDRALRARSVTSLVVTGTMTDSCVRATVTAALHREYRVTVVKDGAATLWPEIQRGIARHRRAGLRAHGAKQGHRRPDLSVVAVTRRRRRTR